MIGQEEALWRKIKEFNKMGKLTKDKRVLKKLTSYSKTVLLSSLFFC